MRKKTKKELRQAHQEKVHDKIRLISEADGAHVEILERIEMQKVDLGEVADSMYDDARRFKRKATRLRRELKLLRRRKI